MYDQHYLKNGLYYYKVQPTSSSLGPDLIIKKNSRNNDESITKTDQGLHNTSTPLISKRQFNADWSEDRLQNKKQSTMGTIQNGKIILPNAYGLSSQRVIKDNQFHKMPLSANQSIGYLIAHQNRPVGPSLPKIVVLQDKNQSIKKGAIVKNKDLDPEGERKVYYLYGQNKFQNGQQITQQKKNKISQQPSKQKFKRAVESSLENEDYEFITNFINSQDKSLSPIAKRRLKKSLIDRSSPSNMAPTLNSSTTQQNEYPSSIALLSNKNKMKMKSIPNQNRKGSVNNKSLIQRQTSPVYDSFQQNDLPSINIHEKRVARKNNTISKQFLSKREKEIQKQIEDKNGPKLVLGQHDPDCNRDGCIGCLVVSGKNVVQLTPKDRHDYGIKAKQIIDKPFSSINSKKTQQMMQKSDSLQDVLNIDRKLSKQDSTTNRVRFNELPKKKVKNNSNISKGNLYDKYVSNQRSVSPMLSGSELSNSNYTVGNGERLKAQARKWIDGAYRKLGVTCENSASLSRDNSIDKVSNLQKVKILENTHEKRNSQISIQIQQQNTTHGTAHSRKKSSMGSRKESITNSNNGPNHYEKSEKTRTYTNFHDMPTEVQKRLSQAYDKDRRICSTHSHKSMGSYQEVQKVVKPKKEFKDAALSPRQYSVNDKCQEVTDGAFSDQEVDLAEIQREIGTDPMPGKTLVEIQTQTEHPVIPDEPEVEKIPKILDKDWRNSAIFKLVKDLMSLPPKNRQSNARLLEKDFFNPNDIDIFTEEEAIYNASILMKKGEEELLDQVDQNILEELAVKAKITIELLSEHLLLSIEESLDQVEDEEEPQTCSPEKKNNKKSIILLNQRYLKNTTPQTVIKLLLRCRKLYQALFEIKKILQLIIKQEEIFSSEDGIMYMCYYKYFQRDIEMPTQDVQAVIRGIQVLQKVSRRISHFLQDHRLFKQSFIFDQNDHQQTLLMHAKKLSKLLKDKKPMMTEYSKPTLDIDGCLQFLKEEYTMNDFSSENSANVQQNAQEGDESLQIYNSQTFDEPSQERVILQTKRDNETTASSQLKKAKIKPRTFQELNSKDYKPNQNQNQNQRGYQNIQETNLDEQVQKLMIVDSSALSPVQSPKDFETQEYLIGRNNHRILQKSSSQHSGQTYMRQFSHALTTQMRNIPGDQSEDTIPVNLDINHKITYIENQLNDDLSLQEIMQSEKIYYHQQKSSYMIPTPNNKFETATEESVVYRQHGNFSNSDMCESDNLTERINQEITKFKNYR